MQWVSEILKHLSVSKLFATALFLSSASILFGHYIFPSQVPTLKTDWKIGAISIFVFTGTYIFVWLVRLALDKLCHIFQIFRYWLGSQELSEIDKGFIEIVSMQPGQTLNLRALEYEHGQISQLELIQHGKNLAARGLVQVNRYDESMVTLTERGKALGARILAENRKKLRNA